MMKNLPILLLTTLCSLLVFPDLYAQVTLTVRINSGNSTTTCTDNFFQGAPDPHWRVEVAGQGYTTYPRSGICFTNPPNTQYNETFTCPNAFPATLQICLRAFEDDGTACVVGQSCLEQVCQNFATPTPGNSITYNLNVGGSSTANVNFTITATGSFNLPGSAYNTICNAINLGTLASNGTVGNSGLSNYGNFCADNVGEPNPWGGDNDQGVWFQFTTGPLPAAVIEIEAESDPQNLGNDIDLQLALYESSNGTCSGALTLIDDSYQGLGLFNDEDMSVNCLAPNTTYFILVDGERTALINNGGQEGFFGIEVNDNGILQAGDLICDAEFLGAVPAGGAVATPNLSRSNVCATNTNDPTPGAWAPDQSVWFRFQAPPSGHVIIEADSDLPFPLGTDAVDLQLAIYSTSNNACTGTPNFIASDYTPGLFGEELDVKCLTPGQNYWVLVDGSPLNVDGIFDLTIRDGGIPPAPNDLVCDAIPLGNPGNGGTVGLNNQNNYCADNIFEPIPNNWGNDQGVWYTFIAPPSGKVEVRLDNGNIFGSDNIDLQVAVYDLAGAVCTGGPTELRSQHNGVGVLWDEDMEVECLIPGREYWILVDGEGSLIDPDLQEGIFDIEVYGDPRDPASPYDDPCNAFALGDPTGSPVGTTPGPNHGSQNNFCATATGEPQPSGFTADQTVWYTFVAPSTGNVNINLNSDPVIGGTDPINLQIAVWETPGCTGPWREFVSGDDLIYDVDLDVFCLTPGETYYIQIDGSPPTLLGGHEGYFDITITEIPSIPVAPNDSICNAIALGDPFAAGPVGVTNQQNLCADDLGDPNPSAFGTDQTVWYTFTTPATGGPYAVDIDCNSSLPWPFGNQDAIDLQIAVFSSSNNLCTGALTEVESGYSLLDLFDESLNVRCLEANRTYYIMVDGSFLDVQGYFDISVSAATAVPIPTNDLICQHEDLGALPIGGNLNNNVNYYNYCSDVEPGEPNPFPIEQTVWFSFVAPNYGGPNATANVTISVNSDPNNVGDPIDLQLAVYESSNGTCTGNMRLLENGDSDPLFSFDADVSVTCLYPGQRYWVQVDGSLINQEGYFTIEVRDDGSGFRPPYNIICNAEPLGTVPNGGSINNGVNYTNLCSDTEPGEPNPNAFNVDKTVWFTFQAPASGNVRINADNDPNNIGDEIDLQLALYYSPNNTCSGPFLEVDSDYDAFNKDESLQVDCLEPGRTYFLQVDGSNGPFGDEDGWFTLEIIDDGGTSNFPYNNDICNAFNFGVPATPQTRNNESNICANVELNEPGVGNYATHTVWYQFTAPPSGRVEIDVVSTNLFLGMDPEVRLFSSSNNSCTGNLSRIETSNFPTALITENIEATCLIPGNTYFIQVDGSNLVVEGTFNITVEDMYPAYGTNAANDPEPSNNACDSAITLPVQSQSCLTGSGTFSNLNYGLPTITYNPAFAQGCGGNCGDTWYQFTMPASGNAVIEGNDDNIGGGIVGDFSDLVVAAYTGTCNNLTPITCDQGGLTSDVSFQVAAPPGTTIWLQVFNDDGDDDEEDYQLCVSEGCGFDNCLDALAVPMQPNVAYCFNTAGANGENIAGGAPGYFECSEGDNPENSVYFYFVSDCNGSDVTLSVINAVSNGNCILGVTPTDGFNISLFQDGTPCDNNPDSLVDCQTFTACDVQPVNWSQTYTGLSPNTPYVIQIDGGFGALGGDNVGEIMITTTTDPVLTPVSTPVTCSGINNGTASAVTQGGVGPFTFLWSNNQTDSTITNLAAGTYSVTVTGSNGCFDTASVTVLDGLAVVATMGTSLDVSCNNTCDGQATVLVVGGTVATGYTYQWDTNANNQTTATATGLCIGTYVVTVSDDNGCSDTASVTIGTPNPVIAQLDSSRDATCNGICDGQATVSASGGSVVGNYNYLWSDNQTTATATNLCAGTYTVTISDDNGCFDTLTVVINQPVGLIATLANQTDIACQGDSTGAFEVLAVNGNLPYTYTLFNSAGSLISSSSSNIFTNLPTDTYTAVVADASGCSDSVITLITSPNALASSLVSSSNISCAGGNDGSISVQANAGTGTAPYSYAIDGINFSSSGNFNNLVAGPFTITTRDSNNCETTLQVTLTEPAPININLDAQTVASCGICDGSASITIVGGNAPLSYAWPSGETSEDATALCSGSNTVTVTDANGCTATLTVNIGNSNSFAVTTAVDQALACFGDCDGQVRVIPPAIGAPHAFLWDNGSTADSLSNLCAGSYTVTVTDNSGCFVIETILLTAPDSLSLQAAQTQGVSCAGLADGQAIATPIGGTAPYTYNWDNTETTANATQLNAGPHQVSITDANGCTASASITITEPSSLTVSIQNTTPSNCSTTGCDGSATVSVSGGQAPYTYAWSNGNTTAAPTNLCPNFNDVTVTDANGCTATVGVLIPANTSLNLSLLTTTAPSCHNSCDGSAAVGASGGNNTAPYTFIWDDPAGQTTANPTGLCAGDYRVTVSDIDGCSAALLVTITAPDSLDANAIVTSNYNGQDLSCHTSGDGTAEVLVTGGTGPYTYQWSANALSATTPSIINLIAQTYQVTVTDANGCSDTSSVTLVAPSSMLLSNISVVTTPSCNNATDGNATINVVGGVPPYQYNWSNNQTSDTLSQVGAGFYMITVLDANNCNLMGAINITEPAPIAITTTINQQVSCFSNNDGSASVTTISGGTSPYQLLWDNGQTDSTATGLNAGMHYVVVTDDNGCSDTTFVNITEPNLLTVTIGSVQASGCFGNSSGQATAVVAGGTGPYNYAWSNTNTSATATNLPIGMQFVTVTDANGCIAVDSVLITEPTQLSATTSSSDASCADVDDGSITVNPTGGTPGYAYAWSHGPNTPTVSGLAAGTYTVTITDLNGCDTSLSIVVSAPPAIITSTSIATPYNGQQISCADGNDGSASISVFGGIPGYTYQWFNGETTATITGLQASTYPVTVTDATGCTAVDSVTLMHPDPIVLNTTITSSYGAYNVSCHNSADGSALVIATGGTGAYTYLWSDGQTTDSVINLVGGTYAVTVTDANGCFAVITDSLTAPPALLDSITNIQPVACAGDSNGQATVVAFGGSSPYTYLWSNGSTTATVNNLSTGGHQVTITDANGCAITDNVYIGTPTPLTASSSSTATNCSGSSDGSLSVTASGGTSPYSYLWSNNITSAINNNLSVGTYTVTITDANGCSISLTDSVIAPSPIQISLSISNNISCTGNADGGISSTVTGGTAPYRYLWNTGNTGSSINNLSAGNYTLVVEDANGCLDSANISISDPAAIQATASVSSNYNGQAISCINANDGAASVTVVGGTAPFTYLWPDGQSTDTAVGLGPNWYVVTVTDANGCSDTAGVQLTDPPTVAFTFRLALNVTCAGGNDGKASIIPTSGTTPLSFLWDDGSISATNDSLTAGVHTATVTDANGCSVVGSVTITEPSPIFLTNASSTPVFCHGDSNGTATITVAGGTGGYTYVWSNGQTGATASNLSAGIYEVTATDASGCTFISQQIVTQPAPMSISFTNVIDIDCNANQTGSATAIVAGGVAPYTYRWNGISANNASSANNLNYGWNTLQATDVYGCSVMDSVFINHPNPLQVTSSSTNISCPSANDGTATVTATGGTPPLTYAWSNQASASNSISGIAANFIFYCTITDANGCIHIETFQLTEPSAISTQFTQVDNADCNNGSNGRIVIEAQNGVAPYTFTWSTGTQVSGVSSATLDNLNAGNYQVTITDQNGCFVVRDTTITDPNQLALTVQGDTLQCFGDTDGVVQAAANGGTGPYFFSLNNGNPQNSGSFTGLGVGTYTVNVTDASGCTLSQTVQVVGRDSVLLVVPDDQQIRFGQTIPLFVQMPINSPTNPVITWTPPTGLSCTDCYQLTAQPFETTRYVVSVTGDEGCISTADVLIEVEDDRGVYVPNAFSPNNDRINDVFMLYSSGSVESIESFMIFDRWGELICQHTEGRPNYPAFGWDGTFKGQPLNPGVFVYFIKVRYFNGTTEVYKGDVTLLR